jgi:hypothetical protein
LVESNIKYLPLYPDDIISTLNEEMINTAKNILSEILPDMKYLEGVLKVVNVPESYEGKRLRILMNADKNEAAAFLADYNFQITKSSINDSSGNRIEQEPWQFRMEIAKRIVSYLKRGRYGVMNIYLIGTVFHRTAGPNSDIDLMVHYNGEASNREKLEIWFDGWNCSLSEMVFNQTGVRLNRFLDVIYITDNDLRENEYFATLIDENKKNSKKLEIGK